MSAETVVVIAVIVAFIIYRYIRANRAAHDILRVRSETLATLTGLSAGQIYHEMVSRRLTPGEWAASRGLDPITFFPRTRTAQESMLDQAWARFRLDTFAPSPGPEALLKIGDLHYDLAPLLAEPAPLIKELQRQREILLSFMILAVAWMPISFATLSRNFGDCQ